MSKKSIIILVVAAVAVIGIYSFFKSTYNSMVVKQEYVGKMWADVESQYQRRADLIPNLVSSVKGYAEHEKSTLTDVIEARSKATQLNLTVDDLSDQNLAKFNAAQGELSQALSRLLAVSESYPDLKANQSFLDLQAQLEGTENRIATERRKFNEAVQGYNAYIRLFPRNIIAGMFGFDAKAYFAATEGSEKAPEVKF